ncbi:MAG: zinc ribbon domain-containing protein [Elusimicrobia bacterium]|nr:zinc ribbon domain-containing protein [Elusimicrobiota bacterium]
MSLKCPSCGKDNADGARACAYCPESFDYEDDDERPRQKFKRIDPGSWPIHYWLVVFAGVGFAIWRILTGVLLLGEEGARNPIKRFIKGRTEVNLDPDKNLMAKGMQVILGTAPPAGLAEAREMRRGIREDDAAGNPGDWRLNGTVFDLVTLGPIPDCAMEFKGKGRRVEAKTDENGHYAVAVPPLERGGYKVILRHPSYAGSYLNPGAEHVAQMPAEDRKGLAQDLTHSDDGQYEVQPAEGAALTTDFYLAPKSQ